MLTIPIYQVDAFASHHFTGNPAAVCPLERWLPDSVMQHIAMENNLSETAFFVDTDEGFHIRWFTPVTEVDLCGHATLATAHVIFNYLAYPKETIFFESLSGPLKVTKEADLLVLDFPADDLIPIALPDFIKQGVSIYKKDIDGAIATLEKGYAFANELNDTKSVKKFASTIAQLRTKKGDDLPYAKLGSSHDLIIGEWSIAVGNPYGFLIKDSKPSVSEMGVTDH